MDLIRADVICSRIHSQASFAQNSSHQGSTQAKISNLKAASQNVITHKGYLVSGLSPSASCCTQFKFPGVKILCILYLHYKVAYAFK